MEILHLYFYIYLLNVDIVLFKNNNKQATKYNSVYMFKLNIIFFFL